MIVKLVPSVGMSQVDRDWVCAYDRESMRRFSLGSHNLTKLNKMTSSICIRFLIVYDIWLW
jgi:hypothetical protein